MKEYYEFNSESELNKHLKYWSSACGTYTIMENMI